MQLTQTECSEISARVVPWSWIQEAGKALEGVG